MILCRLGKLVRLIHKALRPDMNRAGQDGRRREAVRFAREFSEACSEIGTFHGRWMESLRTEAIVVFVVRLAQVV
jgi:hypothetical protein